MDIDGIEHFFSSQAELDVAFNFMGFNHLCNSPAKIRKVKDTYSLFYPGRNVSMASDLFEVLAYKSVWDESCYFHSVHPFYDMEIPESLKAFDTTTYDKAPEKPEQVRQHDQGRGQVSRNDEPAVLLSG